MATEGETSHELMSQDLIPALNYQRREAGEQG